LSYVDGPATPSTTGQPYLNPSVRNAQTITLGADGDTTTTVSQILSRLGRGGLRQEVASPTEIAVTAVDDASGGLWVYDTGSGYQSLTNTPSALVQMTGDRNDLVFFSTDPTRQVQLIDSGPGGGNVVNLEGNILTFRIDVASGFRADDLVALLAGDVTLNADFSAELVRDSPASVIESSLEAFGPLDFANVSASSALLLGSTNTLAFIADHDFDTVSGPKPTVTFRSWDGVTGAAGDFADSTTNGSGTPFSTATADAVVNIADPIEFTDAITHFANELSFLLSTDSY
jgi:hypothetical protein